MTCLLVALLSAICSGWFAARSAESEAAALRHIIVRNEGGDGLDDDIAEFFALSETQESVAACFALATIGLTLIGGLVGIWL